MVSPQFSSVCCVSDSRANGSEVHLQKAVVASQPSSIRRRWVAGTDVRVLPRSSCPETIADLGAGVSNDAELEPSGGVPHGERGRFVEAIALAKGSAEILVQEFEKRENRIAELDGQIEQLQIRLEPLLLPQIDAVRDYVLGYETLFRGDVGEDRAFLKGVLDGIFVHPDGALVLAFREDGLFGRVASYELTSGNSLAAPPASLVDRRSFHAELLRDTLEWAGSDARPTIHEAEGFVFAKPSAPLNPVKKTAGVPHHSELEPSGGVPHRLGGASEDGGVTPPDGRRVGSAAAYRKLASFSELQLRSWFGTHRQHPACARQQRVCRQPDGHVHRLRRLRRNQPLPGVRW